MEKDRSAKELGLRYNLPAINRSVGFNPYRLALYYGPAILAFLILCGIAFSSFKKKNVVYSAGALSSAHAFLGNRCEVCHAPSGGFKREVKDNQCRTCHEGNDANDNVTKKVSNTVPDHQKNQISSDVPACASCHIEHRGLIRPAQMPDAPCIQCHGQESLKTTGPSEHCKDHPWHRWPFMRVTGFGEPYAQAERHAENPASTANLQPCTNPQPATVVNDGPHPRFSAEPGEFHNPTTITFSHAAHLNLKEINKQPVKLECNDCHRPVADIRHTWPYSSPQIADAALGASPPRGPGQKPLSSKVAAVALNSGPARDPGQTPYPDYGRPLMTMPKYEQSCATSGCHDLTFANGIKGLDHPKSRAELESSEGRPIFPSQIQTEIAGYLKNNGELPSITDWPAKCVYDKNGRPACPKIVEKPEASPKDGLEQRVADAEKFMWKARCRLCHEPSPSSLSANKADLPTWTKAAWTDSDMVHRFMPYSIFSHQAHSAVSCEGCHVPPPTPDCCKPAPQSHDIHIPGIETCAKCHSGNPPQAGQAGNGCFLCHQYHPWDPSREMFRSRHTIEELTGWTPPQPKQGNGN